MSERFDPQQPRHRRAEDASGPGPAPRPEPRPAPEGRHTGTLDDELDLDTGRRNADRYDEYEEHEDDRDDAFAGLLGGPREIGDRVRHRRQGGGPKRVAGWVIALGVVAALALVSWFGVKWLLGPDYEDYTGTGREPVVVEVGEGDTTSDIAKTLAENDVVAHPMSFVEEASENKAVTGIQPGFYKVKTQMSAASAVEAITAKDAKVDQVEIKGGTQLHDLTGPDDKKVAGIYTLLAEGSCANDGKCIKPQELKKAAGEVDLKKIGVPDWIRNEASKAPDGERRLEGLIAPGIYSVKPGADAEEILAAAVKSSVKRYENAGLPDAAEGTGYKPYELLIIASIVEREAITKDFGKVSQVVYNRMQDGQGLQMDSTVNYELDRPTIRTSNEDRGSDSPYNTYQVAGLPPTPISAPSPDALQSAIKPEDGEWRYFVKCETDGTSCFAENLEKHETNVREAQEKGVW